MEKVNERGETLEQFLENYDDSMYRHPSNTVDMILMTVDEGKLKMLLIKRKDHPFIGDWAMPGGFVNFDEDLDAAVLRELSEETSITENSYFRQLYTFGQYRQGSENPCDHHGVSVIDAVIQYQENKGRMMMRHWQDGLR